MGEGDHSFFAQLLLLFEYEDSHCRSGTHSCAWIQHMKEKKTKSQLDRIFIIETTAQVITISEISMKVQFLKDIEKDDYYLVP